jgi:hypothetical protein
MLKVIFLIEKCQFWVDFGVLKDFTLHIPVPRQPEQDYTFCHPGLQRFHVGLCPQGYSVGLPALDLVPSTTQGGGAPRTVVANAALTLRQRGLVEGIIHRAHCRAREHHWALHQGEFQSNLLDDMLQVANIMDID